MQLTWTHIFFSLSPDAINAFQTMEAIFVVDVVFIFFMRQDLCLYLVVLELTL